jgi:hypothetical protein
VWRTEYEAQDHLGQHGNSNNQHGAPGPGFAARATAILIATATRRPAG